MSDCYYLEGSYDRTDERFYGYYYENLSPSVTVDTAMMTKTQMTDGTLLAALNLQGSFHLQVYSPERLCGRIFEAAGQPEGVRVDERGRVMLVRAAVQEVNDRLKLYRGAAGRTGFAG